MTASTRLSPRQRPAPFLRARPREPHLARPSQPSALRGREPRSDTALPADRPGQRHRLGALNSRRSAPLRSPGRVGSAGGRDCRPRAPVAPRSRPGPARLPDSSRSGLRRGGEPPCQRPAERPPAARHPGPRSSPAATRPALLDSRHGPAPPGRLSERGGRRRGHGTAAERGAGPGGAAPSPDWPGGESGYTWAAVRREPPRCLRPRDGRGGAGGAPQLPRPVLLVRRRFGIASLELVCPRLVLVVIPERCFAMYLLKEKVMLFMPSYSSPFK